jgi:hypothetical protein
MVAVVAVFGLSAGLSEAPTNYVLSTVMAVAQIVCGIYAQLLVLRKTFRNFRVRLVAR